MAIIRRNNIAIVTLVLSVAINCKAANSPVVISGLDRYEKQAKASLDLGEATDRIVPERFQKKLYLDSKAHEHLLQKHAQLQEKKGDAATKSDNFKAKSKGLRSRRKRSAEERSKRGFYPYPTRVIQAPPIQSFTYFDPPQAYQIQRPYIIPVWGAPNRIPIYFPPQPLYSNPGLPPHNPPVPDRGYLPVPSTTEPTDNRFNTFSSEDDRPVWGGGDDNRVTQPTTQFVPTRRPRPQTTFPPLIHGGSNQTGNNLDAGQGTTRSPPTRTTTSPPRTTQTRPIPTRPTQTRPTRPRPTTTSPPIDQSKLGGLSQCIWATVSCCSGINSDISYSCFEQLGCVGAFWDTNPCDSAFAKAAIEAALNYYN